MKSKGAYTVRKALKRAGPKKVATRIVTKLRRPRPLRRKVRRT